MASYTADVAKAVRRLRGVVRGIPSGIRAPGTAVVECWLPPGAAGALGAALPRIVRTSVAQAPSALPPAW